jgi:PAS domain S-box-containing protein
MSKANSQSIESLYPLILDSIDQGVFTVNGDFVVTSFNAAAERIIGMSREEAIGQPCHHVFRASICETGCALRQTLETGEPLRNVRIDVLDRDMQAVPLEVSTAVLRGRGGQMIGGVEMFRDISELETLRQQLTGQPGFADIIGISAPMRELFGLLPDVADSDAPVLIEGPSGSGKELVARAVHDLSARRDKPFVRVNCGALPDTLLESELFGYRKGAFTDARRDKTGRFVEAHEGTLLLDEIGDVSPAFQVKLLRVLEEGELQPLGATESIPVDVRILSSTNRDLAALVAQGRFREDLYYRLRVVPLRIPPLRERREDIPLLVEHFVARGVARTGRPIQGLTPAAMDALMAHDFPGNVRELRNLIERAFVLCREGEIDLEHLLPEVGGAEGGAPSELCADRQIGQGTRRGVGSRLKPSERRILGRPAARPGDGSPQARRLVEALDAHGWNRTETAAALGIARNTLWRRMRDYGLLDG